MSVNDDRDLSFCLSTCVPISNKCKDRTLMIYAILLLVDDATCSHQAPGLTFQTSSRLYFHRTLSPSFPSFPPLLRHCKRHSLVSSPPLSIVNMAAISFEHVNTGKHRISGLSSLLWTLEKSCKAKIWTGELQTQAR